MSPRRILQVRITVAGVRPAVWRRVQVPGGFTLDRVHRVVQHSVGWRDCRLHSFEIDGTQYGQPDPDGELGLRDELDVRLDAVVGRGARVLYVYDFEDWWEHDLLVEDVCVADPARRYPACLDGERAGPPEGVGGPSGYAALRAALADPAHPEHAVMSAWVGSGFDPDAFDPGRVSTLLRRFC
ncbi:plasmid pRiA4b ORF-3 family protein [Micromonospora sp. KC606]|uniref:plasmid pRiA4b ORF-3 family protein n=1 Tax=Micromonospora sp. KC606 TaxID=2530379 RepID=UPI001044BE44|nr:plasmid pRiA4b ORF-3 family protein [Micromonospora sp. KC606]TDC76490.1 plasmid pRiA4b ORF-3 family protein [Micromonospora sp. KC606]